MLMYSDGCCSAVVLAGFTCPATTVGTVTSRALDRVRERALGLLCHSITQIPARQAQRVTVVLRLFYGLLALASEMDTVVEPSSKRKSRTTTAGKPPSYRADKEGWWGAMHRRW